MWPFHRREASLAGRGSVAVHRAPRTEWHSAPPMPIVQARSFATVDAGFEHLLTTRDRPMFLAPLGHQVAPYAPAGVVSGLAQPAVQRSFATPPGAPRTPQMTPQPARSADTTTDRAVSGDDMSEVAVAAAAPSRALVAAPAPDVPPRPTPTVTTPEAVDSYADDPPTPLAEPAADEAGPSLLPLVAQRAVLEETGREAFAPVEPAHPAAPAHRPIAGSSRSPSTAAVPTVSRSLGSPRAPQMTASDRSSPAVPAVGVASTQRSAPMVAAVPTMRSLSPSASGAPAVTRGSTFDALDVDAAPPMTVEATRPAAPAGGETGPPPVGEGETAVDAELPADVVSPRGSEAATVLPLVGGEPPAPTAVVPLPEPTLPPVTTSATTKTVQRRTMIGDPLDPLRPPPIVARTVAGS